jgi:pimeloyl-ACP methyl ester carboxylesterase
MRRRCLPALAALVISLRAAAAETLGAVETQTAGTGLQREVVFGEYSPLSRSAEVAQRMLSPLAKQEIARVSANSHLTLREQSIDLAHERFAVYVPATAPPQGYALLSFIPPWQGATLPSGWARVLDKHGMIFVSASNSGNSEKTLDRRIPLALLGAYNIMQRYPVDKDRVYVGGLSGGSRVAMRVALSFPDLFHGALLNAGSDPIGNGQAILPQADLLQLFQSTRLVYVTGTADTWNFENDVGSRQSMNDWCVFQTFTESMQRAGHEIAPPAALDHALSTLDARAAPDAEKLAECRQRIAKQMSAKLRDVNDLLERGKSHDAWQQLVKLDVRYGGLAAPQSIEIGGRIGGRR